MATTAQIYAALTIENTYNILNVTAPINFTQFNDITDWSALGYSSGAGDAIKLIAKVVNPAGQTVYENSGYASADFSTPDCTLTDHSAPQFNLLPYTGTTTPVYGSYIFSWKVRVTPNGVSAFEVDKEFYVELNEDVTPTLSLTESYNCGNATYTSLDSTNYGSPSGYSLQSIVRTHSVVPPAVSLQSNGTTPQATVTADAQTIFLSATANPLWNNATYQAILSVVLTYKNGNNYTITHSHTAANEAVNCDNNFCKLMCCLQTLIDKYNFYKGSNPTEANFYFQKWQKGTMWFFAIMQEYQCSNPTLANAYNTQFYLDTGCDANCDCDCTDSPAPVVPTSSINGTNGTNGLTAEFRVTGTLFQWRYTTDIGWNTLFDFSSIAGVDGTSFLQGSGIPSSGLGINGDSYLDIDTYDIYLKSAGSWAVTGNLKGPQGLTLIYSDVTTHTTANTSPTTLNTATIPVNSFETIGDSVRFEIVVSRTFAGSSPSTIGLFVGGTVIPLAISFSGGQNFRANIAGTITRSSGTQVIVEASYINYVQPYTSGSPVTIPKTTINSLNFAATIAIQVTGQSAVAGDLIEEFMQAILYKI